MSKDLIIEGRNPVLEYLHSDHPISRVLINHNLKGEHTLYHIFSLIKKRGIPIEWADKHYLNKLSVTKNHQGIMAFLSAQKYYAIEDLPLISQNKKEAPFYILLDGIEDPHNLGAVIRSADGAGAHAVIIPKRRSASVTPTVSKTSAGAIAHVPVVRLANLNVAISKLKEQNVWIMGVDQDSDKSYNQADFTLPLALVIGSEGGGISKSVKDNCDFVFSIPMRGKVNSLNASVSAAVVMYEVVRQRMER